ncbi:MAG: hypothetical protein A2521_11635 [Deltaproteobacteria bacterium RIFOXYD12_FULL_57_12]|nr:MAG: hypothetical protein A2521_11635 [Deltaproteobacteria bacterium RIFOXYD12_FULL_57_12]
MIEISQNILIREDELSFTFSRSSGPGGQNVNKVNTRVTLLFDVEHSSSLPPDAKSLVLQKLSTRINKLGQLQVSSYRHRTQFANRLATVERFVDLLQEALRQEKPRKKTKASRASRERRLAAKLQRSRLKQSRRSGTGE